jgi:hypothetical protein
VSLRQRHCGARALIENDCVRSEPTALLNAEAG